MALMLALAECLDTTQMHLAKIVSADYTQKEAHLAISIDQQQGLIELQALDKHRKWFKREFGRELIVRPE